jgi:hypothetical protein
MKGVLSRLVRWARRAGTRDFCPTLPALVGPVQNIFFLRQTLFQLICRDRPAGNLLLYIHYPLIFDIVAVHLSNMFIIIITVGFIIANIISSISVIMPIILIVFVVPFILSRLFLSLFVIFFQAGLSFSEQWLIQDLY